MTTPTTTPTTLHDLTRTWIAAELAADTATLGGLLADDFTGVGPFGFVLDRDRWLRRFADGLDVTALEIADTSVRRHADVDLLLATWTQTATYRGRPTAGAFRLGAVADAGKLVSVQLSGPMPGRP